MTHSIDNMIMNEEKIYFSKMLFDIDILKRIAQVVDR